MADKLEHGSRWVSSIMRRYHALIMQTILLLLRYIVNVTSVCSLAALSLCHIYLERTSFTHFRCRVARSMQATIIRRTEVQPRKRVSTASMRMFICNWNIYPMCKTAAEQTGLVLQGKENNFILAARFMSKWNSQRYALFSLIPLQPLPVVR